MRQFILAAALVLAAIGVFWGGRNLLAPASAQPLGELGLMQAIVTDVQAKVAAGDMAAAQTRITDLETAWDDGQAELQPKNPEAWGQLDGAIDAALQALRASQPDPATAADSLVRLRGIMADPISAGQGGGLVEVGGIAVTDAAGHPLPCEAMLTDVKTGISANQTNGRISEVNDLMAKATERCNADDDRNANQFSAKALGLLKG